MNFALKPLDLHSFSTEKTDALLIFVTSAFKPNKDAASAWIAKVLKSGDLAPKSGEALAIFQPDGLACSRLLLMHVGDGGAIEVRKALSGAMGLLKAAKPKAVTLCFLHTPTPQSLRAAITGLAEATYVYTATKSKAEGCSVQTVSCVVPNEPSLRFDFDRAVAAVAGIELAKEWGNRPANHATPSHLADAARELAKLPNIKCKILGPKEVAKLGMGAFQAVAQGSEEPLRFIVLRYGGAAKSTAPVVLVGKGITFDSGGISIKPAAEMDEMKFDMCGAASVLGVFRALADLQPGINVVGLIPSCENLLSGRAVKPGDVVTSLSGQTIEILNTDAEGRLVLCDALTYSERFKPQAVIDIATLTGACVIALGAVRSGLFSVDQALAKALLQAGESSLDLCWQMPLDVDYAEGLKTNFADIANVAGRPGGAITAAKFLQKFTAKFPWAHLDIAGTAWKGGKVKGATGRPVGLLVDYLMAIDAQGDKP
ncbi:leucyl aminopeptidase [Rhodoferax antarcticus]|uniref:leucyl aminopeptidase n=1 Tax=Rhodoferax antarcticus TaxID=81479 RepID=UPI0022244AAB|nr:leucyl aminopeptidase [Rhodoferax antarcticus]MCW2313039.1 leucyl aminopeptidase [Rhodoferax antarcticus]